MDRLILHGGPGIGIVERGALTSTYFEGLRAQRDLVAFDQRGVDTSAGRETRCLATRADQQMVPVLLLSALPLTRRPWSPPDTGGRCSSAWRTCRPTTGT